MFLRMFSLGCMVVTPDINGMSLFSPGNSLAVVKRDDHQDYPENVKEIIRQVQAYIFTRRIRVKAPKGAAPWRTLTMRQKSSGCW